MVMVRFAMNKLFYRLFTFLVLGLICLATIIFINSSSPFSMNAKSIFFVKKTDVSKFTSLFQTTLKPTCPKFTEYKLSSSTFWQFYGFKQDDKSKELNIDNLSNILDVTSEQELEIERIHNLLKSTYLTDNYKPFKNMRTQNLLNKGIVYLSGKEYYWLTMLSIKFIRSTLGDNQTPIEIFVPYKKKDDYHCHKIELVYPNVKCRYFSDYLTGFQLEHLSGYQYKSLALLLSSFDNILYLDSDNVPLVKPSLMFKNEQFLKTGFVSWPDFWKRSTNYKFYKMSGIGGFAQPISTTPSIESGQILINKSTHLKTLILSYYYNFYGPDYFYPLFSQGFPGQGDKETFYMASRVVDEPAFLITGQKTKTFGYKDSTGQYFGQGILQMNPDNFKEFWFLHMNYPKMDLVEKLNSDFFKNDAIQNRYWKLIRNAQIDNTEINFKQKIGADYELEIWKLMQELLKVDFKGFQVFPSIGNDEMADYVKDHIMAMEFSPK